MYHVTVLSNFARAYDKYSGLYSKVRIPESTFSDRFFLPTASRSTARPRFAVATIRDALMSYAELESLLIVAFDRQVENAVRRALSAVR